MKRTFLTRRNAILSPENISWGAYALVIVILLALLRLAAPNFFWRLFTPVFQSADALAVKSHLVFSSFGNAAVLATDNERLQGENSALASENAQLLKNVADLEALVTPGSTKPAGILAGVLTRPPESPYDTLLVSGGSGAGIMVGMEAFGPGNVPVGVVSAVLEGFSRVTLFSSPGARWSGWVGRNNFPLTMLGSGAGTFSASIVRSAGVNVGDAVSLPGPGPLPIGKVIRIDSDPSSPSVTLHIMPSINPFSITWVLVRDTGRGLGGTFFEATSTSP